MFKSNRLIVAAGLLIALIMPASAQVNLTVGDITVSPANFAGTNAIVQVPILLEDLEVLRANNGIRALTVSISIDGDTDIIVGGDAAQVLVFKPFLEDSAQAGIANPGVDLENGDLAGDTPDATGLSIYNPATENGSATFDFLAGNSFTALGGINNNQDGVGLKFATLTSLGGDILATSPKGQFLIGVLELEIVADLNGNATAQLIFNADLGANRNEILFDDPGPGDTITEAFSFPRDNTADDPDNMTDGFLGLANFVAVPDCSGATAADDNGTASGSNIAINYLDANAGGIGGAITLSIPTGLAEQFIVTDGEGYMATIPAAVGTTSVSVSTSGNGTPIDTQDSTTYTITPQVEFPPMSGQFINGAPCQVTVSWAATSCTATFNPTPILGGNTDLDVVVTNARFNGVNYGTVTLPDMTTVDLVAPSSVSGNEVSFDAAVSIAGIDAMDVGTYTVDADGPGSNTSSCSDTLTLEPPVNQTNCNTITEAVIGGSVDIDLAGNDGTVDFTVIYNGTTYDNLAEGVFNLPNISADDTTVTIRANGFDTDGDPIFDEIICNLDFAVPTCDSTTQNPDSTVTPVDVGTVITLTLVTSGAVDAQIDGVSMTPDVDPDNNEVVTWTANTTAVADVDIDVIITNPDGETDTCTFTIDINCEDPINLVVAPVGDSGISFTGTPECPYTVRVTILATGVVTDYAVSTDATGLGFLDIVIPADALIEVGQSVFVTASDSARTVPTLGEWGMIAFTMLLMVVGVAHMRRQRTA